MGRGLRRGEGSSKPLEEVLAAGAREVRLTGCLNPFTTERIERTLPAGLTLAEMVADVLPDGRNARVLIGDMLIPRENWGLVRPKPGTQVIVRAVPRDGGGGKKDPLRTVLMIAIIVTAAAYGGAIAASILGKETAALTLLGELTVGEAFAGVLSFAALAAVNAIVPPAQPRLPNLSGQTRDSPTLFLSGARNDERPFGVVPMVLGRHRVYPPRGAKVFTEIVGDDQYLRLLVVWGYGPVEITDMKIGETPITSFEGVETETVYGYTGDPALTLFPDDVFEDSLNVQLTQAKGWQSRVSQASADELSIDITFPRGLAQYDDAGKPVNRTVSVEVEYRTAGSGGGWTAAGTITATDRRSVAVRRGLRWAVARGQYEVRLRRTTADTDDSRILDDVVWTVLRTFTDEDPVQMEGLAKTAVRIKATGQLNGVVDRLNAVVTSVLPDWDSGTSSWVTRATQNPASIYRAVLQGAANARPVPDSRLDLDQLQHWHELCESKSRTFNMVVDYAASVRQCLADCAAAGRAAPTRRDALHSIVIDEPKTSRVQLFTPRNSWGFKGQKAFVAAPHAWRVRFVNEQQGWLQDERIVYDDGFDANNATRFEGLELPGVTHPDQIWSDARYRVAEGKLRPETFSFFADVENIVCTRGDWVGVAHDVILVGLSWGRVKAVTTDGAGDVTSLTLDETCTMEFGKSYGLSIRTIDNPALTVAIDTDPGDQTVVSPATPIPAAQAPEVGDLFAFGELGSETLDVLVKRIEPGADLSARIVAVPLADAVHDADAGPIPAYESRITTPAGVGAPALLDIRSDEDVLQTLPDGVQVPAIVLSILPVPAGVRDLVASLELAVRPTPDSKWQTVTAPPTATEITFAPAVQGATYDLRLRYIRRDGLEGAWGVTYSHTVVGMATLPADIPRAWIAGGVLRWTYTTPPDHAGYRVRVRPGAAQGWSGASAVHQGLLADTALDVSGFGNGLRTFMIKAVDKAGNESAGVAAVTVGLGDPVVENVIVTDDDAAAGYTGTLTDGTRSGGSLLADDDGGLYLPDGGAPYLPVAAELYLPITWLAMSYERAAVLSPGLSAASLTVDADLSYTEVEFRTHGGAAYLPVDDETYLADGTASYLGGVDEWAAWPGALEVAERERVDFRLRSLEGSNRGRVDTLAFRLDVPDITERLADVAIAAGGTRLPITKTYRTIARVNLTLREDGGDAVSAKVLDYDAINGPLIKCFDGSNAAVAGRVDAQPQGY